MIEMVVTGVLPLVAIGAGVAALFAARDRRTIATRVWASTAVVALVACLWVVLFVFTPR